MIGRSIYLRDRAAFTGASPQAVYEQLWQKDRKGRLRTRAIIAAAALLIGGKLVSPVFGVALALIVAAADALFHWRRRAAASVWRKGLRGDERMARLLRHTLERRGHRVLHRRTVPGDAGILDQLLIGPYGVWLIDNQAWHPETELAGYGGKLFIDDKTPSQFVNRLNDAASTVSERLSRHLGMDVPVTPLVAVHGGKLAKRQITADGITLLRPLRLLRLPARRPTADYTPAQVEAILRAANQTLPIGGRLMTAA